ncbi:translation initiation factor 2 [Cereibacter sediminicola]|uniref:translation initiation factor 2 n=1 Tax=Cereibacter sediminicola TaxID=2584941 RepID=UPI001FE34794|nr:translation initiation factor 2 [Cereibacter sediminicola]
MPDGWEELGRVPFDAPDLDEALAALRQAAQADAGEAGVTAKIVIPNSQVLYTTLAAPGPDRASRGAQIRAGLEGLTPYEVKDLVYDFEPQGDEVRVAVVARETLDEAEGFAEQHGFNPVAFVAIPVNGSFPREPSFGILSAAQRRLPNGTRVERDAEPIRILPLDIAEDPEPAEEEGPADAGPVLDEAAPDAVAPPPAPPVPELPEDTAPAEPEADPPTPGTDEPVAVVPAPAEPEETSSPELPEAFGPAEDEPWEPAPDLAALASLTPDESALALPEPEVEEPVEPEAFLTEAEPAAQAVPQEEPPTPEDEFFMPPPLVRAPERPIPNARELPPFTPPPPPKPAVTSPEVPEAPYVELEGDDVPEMPPGTFASRRVAAEAIHTRPAARVTSEPKPARPAEPVLRAPGGRSALPPRGPAPQTGRAAPPAAVTAPGLAAARPKAQTGPARQQPKTEERPDKPFGVFGGKPAPTRGKPRFLGLILTVALLVLLAAVAALSSYLVAANEDGPRTALAISEATPELLASDQEPPPEEAVSAQPQPEEPVEAANAGAPAEAETPAATEAAEAPAPAAEAPRVVSDEGGRAKPAETPQDEIFLTTMDSPLPSLDAVALPPPPVELDAAPGMPLPPPPFGASYELDERGLIRPSPEGVLAPGEFLLIQGKPPILPPRRPSVAEPEAAAPAAEAAPRAAASPGSIFPGPASAASAEAPTPAVADPALSGRRPKERPARPEAEEAAAEPEAATEAATPRMSSLRPRLRPVDPEPGQPEAQGATLAMALTPAPRPDGAPEAVATSSGAISPLALAVSRKPEARPNDFSDAIEAAVAAAVQAPHTPAPAPAPVVAAAPAPRQVAPAVAAPLPEDDDEPEVVAAPRIPTRANVAQNATFTKAINLSKTNLIGVYGTSSNRYALVRQSNGRYVKLRVGDRLDGGVVAAITASELRYKKGSRMFALSMPKG